MSRLYCHFYLLLLLSSCSVSNTRVDYDRLSKRQNKIESRYGDYVFPDALRGEQVKKIVEIEN